MNKAFWFIFIFFTFGCTLPDAPDEFQYMIDFPRGRGIGFRINSGEGPDFKTFEEMDKYSCYSPEAKANIDNYVKDLRRRASRLQERVQRLESRK